MIFTDSNVFIWDLHPPNSRREEARYSARFLDQAPEVCTSIFNILEICGVLSHHLDSHQLLELYWDFHFRYGIKVLYFDRERLLAQEGVWLRSGNAAEQVQGIAS